MPDSDSTAADVQTAKDKGGIIGQGITTAHGNRGNRSVTAGNRGLDPVLHHHRHRGRGRDIIGVLHGNGRGDGMPGDGDG